MKNIIDVVNSVREFNRFYTVVIGILNGNFLNTEYSVAETRIFFELLSNGKSTANELTEKLKMDKSYMSRILKSFEKKGFIKREVSSADRRSLYIYLTEAGKQKATELVDVTNKQIMGIVKPLSNEERMEVIASMNTIMRLFSKNIK